MTDSNKHWIDWFYVRHLYKKQTCVRCGTRRRWNNTSSSWEYFKRCRGIGWSPQNPVCALRKP